MSLFIKTTHILKTCLVLTNKSIKNSLTKSTQLGQSSTEHFLTNKSLYLADCPNLNLIKVQLQFHLKSFFHSRDIQVFVIFSLPSHTFQIQKDKCKWNNL